MRPLLLRMLAFLAVGLLPVGHAHGLVVRPPEAASPAPAATDAAAFAGRLSCLEESLLADAVDGRLDAHSPFEAALIAGGVGDFAALQHYTAKKDALVDELRRTVAMDLPPRQRAEAIFAFLHRRVLRGGYRIECTDLRRALDEGFYNCVSATVLLNCLADECGLACRGLEMPGHAMSRLLLPDGFCDVETTCPRWFELQSDPKRQAELSAGAKGVSAADRAKAREVSPVEMTAMIYYNRGVDLLGEKRFAEAAAANAKALRLDPTNRTARGNLLATLNNWAIDLGASEHYAEAINLLRQGLALEPAYETFALNYVHLHHRWNESLCRAGHFDEALRVLARAAAEMPDRPYLRQAHGEVYRRWSEARSAAGAASPP